MATLCHCGCGRQVPRKLKSLNRQGAVARDQVEKLATHGLPFMEAGLIYHERQQRAMLDIEEAREGLESVRSMVAQGHQLEDIIAHAIHEEDPSAVNGKSLGVVIKQVIDMNLHLELTCIKAKLKYDSLPELGAEGIAAFMEANES